MGDQTRMLSTWGSKELFAKDERTFGRCTGNIIPTSSKAILEQFIGIDFRPAGQIGDQCRGSSQTPMPVKFQMGFYGSTVFPLKNYFFDLARLLIFEPDEYQFQNHWCLRSENPLGSRWH